MRQAGSRTGCAANRVYASALALATALAAPGARAQELVLSLGGSGTCFDCQLSTTAGLDIASGDLFGIERGGMSLALAGGAAVTLTSGGDAWVGAGPILRLNLGPRWRVEVSSMFGYYHEEDVDLGASTIFMSRIGVNWAMTDQVRVGLAFGHKSNAGLSDKNPGVERIVLTVGYGF